MFKVKQLHILIHIAENLRGKDFDSTFQINKYVDLLLAKKQKTTNV